MRRAYTDALTTWLKLETSRADTRVKQPKDKQKKLTENTVLLVGLLYNMCKVELVIKSENESDINTINKATVEASINNANAVLADKF